jgi:hypothetical protein
MEETCNAYQVLVVKPQGKRKLGNLGDWLILGLFKSTSSAAWVI